MNEEQKNLWGMIAGFIGAGIIMLPFLATIIPIVLTTIAIAAVFVILRLIYGIIITFINNNRPS